MCMPPPTAEGMASTTTPVDTVKAATSANVSNHILAVTLNPRLGSSGPWALKNNTNGDHLSSERFARIQSILFMATASALHFAGFEFARSATIALFTSVKIGFSNPSASPLSTIVMTPVSILVLWLYTKGLQCWGPRKCLMFSTVLFALLLASSALTLTILESLIDQSADDDINQGVVLWRRMAQVTIFSLNVVQSSFVQLLYTQHWSFMGSVSKEMDDATVWFAPIAGLGSIASTLAALGVEFVVQQFGLTGSLGVSSLFLIASGYAAELSYRIAHLYRFEPGETNDNKKHMTRQRIQTNSHSMIDTSIRLFTRVPVLLNLCMEVLTCQSVSFIINFLFLLKVKQCIPNDQHRARWTAKWYARINFFSGVLQFVILPLLMNHWRTKHTSDKLQKLWLVMPLSMIVCATLMTYEAEDLSLFLVTISFALHKVLEYSVRGVAVEMVYVKLDYESRFFGKEIIGLFVDRLGKATTAIVLFSVSYFYGNSVVLDQVFIQALSAVTLLWLFASYPLSTTPRKMKLH
jgi:ATP/ADP translocase